MSFGERLRCLIEEREITQKELARQLNLAPSTMGCYVQDTREPDFSTLKALADFFNVSADYLLERKMKPTNSSVEEELLRIFQSLSPEQQLLYIEQGKAFIKINAKEAGKSSASISSTKIGQFSGRVLTMGAKRDCLKTPRHSPKGHRASKRQAAKKL